MTVPTQPVTVRLSDFGGPAIEGAVVKARLTDIDYTVDGMFVSTEVVTATTDSTGTAILNVFPNAQAPDGLGTLGTRVLFTASIPRSRDLRVYAVVPNEPCNLVDILVDQEDIEGIIYVPPVQVADYAALRAYAGNRNAVYVTGNLALSTPDGISGLFLLQEGDTTSADNGGTILVGAGGRRWRRVWDGQKVHTGWFETVGDGTADDTTALTNAKTYAHGRTLVIDKPRVEYKTGRLVWSGAAASNSVIEIEGGTILRKKVDGLSVFLFQDCDGIVVHANHAWAYGDSQAGEVTSSHTVQFLGCKKCVLNDLNISGAGSTGGGKDNIYLGKGTAGCEDITINGGKALYAQRNGISVVDAKRTVIDGMEIAYAVGSPGAGIDLEANEYDGTTYTARSKCYDTEVRNCFIHGNQTYGVLTSFCHIARIHHNKIYNNGIHGFSNAVVGTHFDDDCRLDYDLRAVSAFDTTTGRITVSGDLSKLPVGSVVQFATENGAAVPATFQTQVRWVVDSVPAANQILLAEYLDYNRKTALSDAGTAGTGAGMTTDPLTSNITLKCFMPGQFSDVEFYENELWDNASFDVNLSFMVNVKFTRNRVRHSGDNGSSSVAFFFVRGLTLSENDVELAGADGGYGLYVEGCGLARVRENTVRNFLNSGIYSVGCSRSTWVGDKVQDCGVSDNRHVQMVKGSGLVVMDMAVTQNERVITAQGLWTDATLTNSTFVRVNAKGAGTSDGNSLVISAGNHPIDCVMRSGALLNGGSPIQLPTFTAMRAYTGPALVIELTAKDLGGRFLYDSTDTTSADNGGTIIVATNGKRWKRIFSGPADIRWFGAKVDGVTDDRAAVQAAVDAHDTVYFPPGITRLVCTSTVAFTYGNAGNVNVYRAISINRSNITLIGEGATIRVIGFGTGSFVANYAFATAKNMTLGAITNFRASGLKFDFDPTGDASSTKRSIYLGGVQGIFLDDIELTSSGTRAGGTLTIQNSKTVRINNFRLKNCTQGMNFSYVDDVQGSNWNFDNFSEAVDFDRKVSNFHLKNLYFTNPTLAGQAIDLNSVEDGSIDGVTFDSVLNGALVNYKYTTAPTYAEYVTTYASWLASTAYTVGQYVLSGDNFYVCTTAGTSATSGGPTGTGTGIVDGTVVWDYTLPPFALSPSKRVTIRGVRGDAVGSSTSSAFNLGIDRTASFAGGGPLEDITLDDVKLTNCGFINIEDVKRFLLKDVLLDGVSCDNTGGSSFGGLTIAADPNYADAHTSGELRNVTLRNVSGKGLRVTSVTQLTFNGLTVDGFNTANVLNNGFGVDLQGLNNRQGIIEIDRTFIRGGNNSPIGWRFSENGSGTFEPVYRWGEGNRIEIATVPSPVIFSQQAALRRVKKRMVVPVGTLAHTSGTKDYPLLAPQENQGMYLCQVSARLTQDLAADAANYVAMDVRSRVGGVDTSVQSSNALNAAITAGAEVSVGLTNVETAVTLAEGEIAYMRLTANGTGATLQGLQLEAHYIDYGVA